MTKRSQVGRRSVAFAAVAALALSAVAIGSTAGGASRRSLSVSKPVDNVASTATPRVAVTRIQHVVVIFQENHSFDDVLGGLCVTDHLACDGTTTGVIHDGTVIPLSAEPDIVPQVDHQTAAQTVAINGGAMNGFDLIRGCGNPTYKCYAQYGASEIPNLRKLAETYAISDRTFSENPVPSWGGHLDLIAGQLNGFLGDNPVPAPRVAAGPGWGCDSRRVTPWRKNSSSAYVGVPACVPRADGFGPFRSSPVPHIPTILDRLDRAGLSWKMYADVAAANTGYIWSTCPTFASCFYDKLNHNKPNPNWTKRSTFMTDAAAGRLPSYSVVLPSYDQSQHNTASMLKGDNYIQGLVSAVMHGPRGQWASTAIFITYDDCGCFYDHVPPPAGSGLGIRVPMVIVSPQAKASFVDHTQASYSSMLAFVEKNWGLAPLTSGDARAYDYCHSFVFATLPCTGPAFTTPSVAGPAAPAYIKLQPSPVPQASIEYMRSHPPNPNDPT